MVCHLFIVEIDQKSSSLFLKSSKEFIDFIEAGRTLFHRLGARFVVHSNYFWKNLSSIFVRYFETCH